MSLQSLPAELLLQIFWYLPSVNAQCLRITCRCFRNMIYRTAPASNTVGRLRKDDDPYGNTKSRVKRLAFLKRLFLLGNVFHDKRDASNICGICLYIRPQHKFPLAFQMDKEEVCEDCIGTLLRYDMEIGHEQTFRGQTYMMCKECYVANKIENFHEHHSGTDNTKIKLMCEVCHRELCDELNCPGWPGGDYLEDYIHMFCDDHDNEEFEGIRCPNCPTLGTETPDGDEGSDSGEALDRGDEEEDEN